MALPKVDQVSTCICIQKSQGICLTPNDQVTQAQHLLIIEQKSRVQGSTCLVAVVYNLSQCPSETPKNKSHKLNLRHDSPETSVKISTSPPIFHQNTPSSSSSNNSKSPSALTAACFVGLFEAKSLRGFFRLELMRISLLAGLIMILLCTLSST